MTVEEYQKRLSIAAAINADASLAGQLWVPRTKHEEFLDSLERGEVAQELNPATSLQEIRFFITFSMGYTPNNKSQQSYLRTLRDTLAESLSGWVFSERVLDDLLALGALSSGRLGDFDRIIVPGFLAERYADSLGLNQDLLPKTWSELFSRRDDFLQESNVSPLISSLVFDKALDKDTASSLLTSALKQARYDDCFPKSLIHALAQNVEDVLQELSAYIRGKPTRLPLTSSLWSSDIRLLDSRPVHDKIANLYQLDRKAQFSGDPAFERVVAYASRAVGGQIVSDGVFHRLTSLVAVGSEHVVFSAVGPDGQECVLKVPRSGFDPVELAWSSICDNFGSHHPDWSEVARAAKSVLEHDADDEVAWIALGVAMLFAPDASIKQSNEAFQQAVRLAPLDGAGWYYLAISLALGGQSSEAISSAHRGIELGLHTRELIFWNGGSVGTKALDRACRAVLEREPDRIDAQLVLGVLSLENPTSPPPPQPGSDEGPVEQTESEHQGGKSLTRS